jgi:hypothetical protein
MAKPKLVSITSPASGIYLAVDADGEVWFAQVLTSVLTHGPKRDSPLKWIPLPSEFAQR